MSQSPERRARSVSPLAAHRESQEIKDDAISHVRQGHTPSPKSSPVKDNVQYDNDAVQRSGSFREEQPSHLETSHVSSTVDHSSGPEDDELPPLPGSQPHPGSVHEHEHINNKDHVTDDGIKFRPKPSPRTDRPVSEPVVPVSDEHDHEEHEKEKKRRSMFGFLKKKKDKDHKEHDDHHKEHKDHKKHKKDKKSEAAAAQ